VSAIVVRVNALPGRSTELVSRLARNLPTEPGEPGELFWMFLRTDTTMSTATSAIDLVGLFSDGDHHPVDRDVIIQSVVAAAGADLMEGEPWLMRSS
jgi:hypothetical protein